MRALLNPKIEVLMRYALRSLMQHRLRSILSSLGVVCAVISFIALMSIGGGAKRETLAQIEQLGLKNILIKAMLLTGEQERNARRQGSHGLILADIQRLRQSIKNVSEIAAVREISATIHVAMKEFSPQILAVTPNFLKVQKLEMAVGRFVNEEDVRRNNLVCVLGHQVAKDMGESGKPGGVLRVGNNLCQVIGVTRSFQRKSEKNSAISTRDFDNTIILPLADRTFSADNVPELVTEIIIKIRSPDEVLSTLPIVRRVMQVAHHDVDDYRIIAPQELLKQANQTQTTFNIVLGSVAVISLLIGGIGIMNIMLANIAERTREIGIRRAVGATQAYIMAQFLMEAVILTSCGGLIGVVLGLVGVWAVSALAGWQFSVTLWVIILPLLMSVLMGIFFGLYPAMQAARMDPIAALRHE